MEPKFTLGLFCCLILGWLAYLCVKSSKNIDSPEFDDIAWVTAKLSKLGFYILTIIFGAGSFYSLLVAVNIYFSNY